MNRTDRPSKADRDGYGAVILHRDRTVTMWSCRRQQWERGTPSVSDLSEWDHDTASRIARHVGLSESTSLAYLVWVVGGAA